MERQRSRVRDAEGVEWSVRPEHVRRTVIDFALRRSDDTVETFLVFRSAFGAIRRTFQPVNHDWPTLGADDLLRLLDSAAWIHPRPPFPRLSEQS